MPSVACMMHVRSQGSLRSPREFRCTQRRLLNAYNYSSDITASRGHAPSSPEVVMLWHPDSVSWLRLRVEILLASWRQELQETMYVSPLLLRVERMSTLPLSKER